MIGTKKQCRYCSNFRYGEIVVIDVATGCQDTYDGVCNLGLNYPPGLILTNQSSDCAFFQKKEGGRI